MKIKLRELFLLILVLAISFGWWLDRSRLAAACIQSEVDAYDARSLAGKFGRLLMQDENYIISFEDGVRVAPRFGQGGSSFAISGLHGIEQVQATVEER